MEEVKCLGVKSRHVWVEEKAASLLLLLHRRRLEE